MNKFGDKLFCIQNMNHVRIFTFLLLLFAVSFNAVSQEDTNAKTFTYEELYDNPYDISKLFIQVQPFYGEFYTTNVNVGFGVETKFYHREIFDIGAHFRTAFGSSFEMTRNAADKNSDVDNQPRAYNYFEIVGTYHIVDREEDTETKFILYSKRYKGAKWAATVPLHTIVPTKMRRIYGVRAGGLSYVTAVDYNKVMENQGVVITTDEGEPIDTDLSIYGDMDAKGFYLGGSITLIKNVAVQPDRIYGTLVNDLIFTAFLDFIITPSVNVKDIFLDGVPYRADEIKTSFLGIRAGMEGRFNRKVGWGYGAEMGWRPGIEGEGLYATVKISFPIFSTKLNYQVESFGK